VKRLPFLALLLGLGGLVPFFALAAGILFFGVMGSVPHLALGMLGYGCVILSFLGAVHWGLALETPAIVAAGGTGRIDRRRLILGVVPALWAWGSLYCGLVWHIQAGIALEILGFLLVLAAERAAWRAGALPPGYMMLRIVLTVGSVLCLATGLTMHVNPYEI